MNCKNWRVKAALAGVCLLTGCGMAGPDLNQYREAVGLEDTLAFVVLPCKEFSKTEGGGATQELGPLVAEIIGGETEMLRKMSENAEIFSCPSEDGAKIGSLQSGTQVAVIEYLEESGWGKISYNGRVAYVRADAVEQIEIMVGTGGQAGNRGQTDHQGAGSQAAQSGLGDMSGAGAGRNDHEGSGGTQGIGNGGSGGNGSAPSGSPTPASGSPDTFPVPGTPGQTPNPGTPGQTPNPGEPGQTPDPETPKQTPDPGEPGQTPDPGTPEQTPDPGESGQTPDPGTPEQTPDPGTPEQTPDPGTPEQTPDPGTPEQTPDPETPEPTSDPGTPSPETSDSPAEELESMASM